MQTRAPLVVGRDRELADLARAVAGTREARGTSVFIVGEAGIGKSRLGVETTSMAFAEGLRIMRGRGSTIGPTVPFRPLAEALLSLFRSGDPPDEQALGPYRPVLGRLVPDWSRGEPEPDGGSVVVLAEGVLRLLATLGRDRGCLLVLEDLHEADAETLAVVEYLVDNLDGLPVVLLATVRSEPCAALDLAGSAAQRGSATILDLRRLEVADVHRLVASCLEVEPDAVPRRAALRLWQDSAGNPFMIEELLSGLVDNGLLIQSGGRWHEVDDEPRREVPATLVRSIANRIDRLGPKARMLLSVAAVLGRRFPLSVVQRVTGMDDRTVLSHLHAGVAAQLVTADEPAPDWYSFQHPLTGEALLAMITPTDRADLSARAADAIETIHPGLPGEWCQLVASLRCHTGDRAGAARLFAEAGRRALADGAPSSAITLLERADELLADSDATSTRAEILESLLYSLAEAGRFDRAFELVEGVHRWGGAGLGTARRAGLHVRLAWVAKVAGRPADGLAQVDTARALLGPDPADSDAAPLYAVAADLALELPGTDRDRDPEGLARRAVAAAERAGLPATECQAWLTIGTVARAQDLAASTACFDRSRTLAEEHRLPIWRIYALVELARNDWLSDGDITGMERVRHEALRVGAITIGYVVDATIALHTVLSGRFAEAAELADACWAAATRLRLDHVAANLQLTRAVLAAHRGRRQELADATAEFHRGQEEGSPDLPLLLGLADAFCALLDEDRPRARDALARLRGAARNNPTTFCIAGRYGLELLVDVVDGAADWPGYEEISASVMSTMRWNNQFVHLAHAVLLGRAGRPAEAEAAVAAALAAGSLYPVPTHLGLRLVAEAAAADGWGEPEAWLRRAEEYFHQADVPAIARACRALLRQTGAAVRQRRGGADQVPAALRAHGVTVREYEVFQLLVGRLGNKAIAGRLHISPRTVEKHVANLVSKTGQPDREALHDYAATVLTDPPPGT
ncbi:helix-turn-helix transcriptional regulator [Actinophytocola sp.]|uniref:helix-turn-helix transcriptional regulator n=1 Tax=Actinophytocola sp. TaxID=1872138 RepID=UPI002D53EE8C|nr:AAA family ATPase [Actinophytocola sp.]HYQ66195.1 AAA family ATPase [Actinophytocola sp.]